MHVLEGVFLEIAFNIRPNYFLRNLIFCLKACLSVTREFEKGVGCKCVLKREETAFHFKIVRHIGAS